MSGLTKGYNIQQNLNCTKSMCNTYVVHFDYIVVLWIKQTGQSNLQWLRKEIHKPLH